MEPSLLRKCQDNARRAEKLAIQTNSEFLTPAEQISLQDPSISPIFFGGDGDCERKMAFFLPSWLEEIHPEEAISAISIVPSFGTPGHRDYLGSVLSLGIRRECLGDLRITPGGGLPVLPKKFGRLSHLKSIPCGWLRRQMQRAFPVSGAAPASGIPRCQLYGAKSPFGCGLRRDVSPVPVCRCHPDHRRKCAGQLCGLSPFRFTHASRRYCHLAGLWQGYPLRLRWYLPKRTHFFRGENLEIEGSYGIRSGMSASR